MPAERTGPVAGVVLAAGASTRMGENKLLFELEGESVVRRAVGQASAAGLDPVVVVLGHDADRVRGEPRGPVVPLRRQPGLRERDQQLAQDRHRDPSRHGPGGGRTARRHAVVTAAMLATLVERYGAGTAPLVISDYDGVNAPPMLYDRSLFPELLTMEGEGCGKQVVRRHRSEADVVAWPAAALTDLDVPDDYARVRSRLAAG
jgi:molybdenum cofactor cytidylyltransferase